MERTQGPLEAQAIEVERFAQDGLRDAWETFKNDPLLYILASLLAVAVSFLTLGILVGPMAVGFIRIVQRRRRGEAAFVSEVFDGLSDFAPSLVAVVLVGLATLLGLALFVVPGLLVIAASCFALHEIAYRKLAAVEAIKSSFRIAKAHALHVLLLLVAVSALNALGGTVVFGCLLTLPFSLVLISVAYEQLTGQTPARLAE